jgi:quercetin dioxygenase-like cupin family protein
MTDTAVAKPTTATTRVGAMLPLFALPQSELLTVNEKEIPLIGIPGSMAFKPLRLDLEAGIWVALVRMGPGTSVPLHYHTGTAEVHTLAGRWHYAEYPDQLQTAGSYLLEPGGSVHTLIVPEDNTEDTLMLVRVEGANIQFAEDGTFDSVLDAVALRTLTDMFVEREGIDPPRYISGGASEIVR